MDMRGRKRRASTASLDMMDCEQSSFPFMQLPLEFRQRVYDFYLLDFNETLNKEPNGGRNLVFPVIKNACYRPIATCEIRASTFPTYSFMDSETAFLSMVGGGREVIISEMPKPVLLFTELKFEVLSYVLRNKLVLDLASIPDFKRYMVQHSLDYLSIIKYSITARCVFPAYMTGTKGRPWMQEYATEQPTMLFQLRKDAQEIEVRCKWKLDQRRCDVWRESLRMVAEKSRMMGQERFTGEDILEVANLLSKLLQLHFQELSQDDLNFDGKKRGKEYSDVRDLLLSKEWGYDHLVCSATLS